MSNKIEQDWEQAVARINLKLEEAAKSIKDAAKLAKDAGISCLTINQYDEDLTEKECEMIEDIDTNVLETAMEEAGWQMSSIGC